MLLIRDPSSSLHYVLRVFFTKTRESCCYIYFSFSFPWYIVLSFTQSCCLFVRYSMCAICLPTVAEQLIAQHNAIKMLYSRVKLVLAYIQAVEKGQKVHWNVYLSGKRSENKLKCIFEWKKVRKYTEMYIWVEKGQEVHWNVYLSGKRSENTPLMFIWVEKGQKVHCNVYLSGKRSECTLKCIFEWKKVRKYTLMYISVGKGQKIQFNVYLSGKRSENTLKCLFEWKKVRKYT